MSQAIIAPSDENPTHISLFLAGGISGCRNWQDDVLRELEPDNISIFNPRQKYFDISDKDATPKQIAWEFERLESMDVFSMYFCNSDSVQPICMYELGRNIIRMQNRFPNDWYDRIVVSIEDGYIRKQDVIIQLSLCAPDLYVQSPATPETHAQHIRNCVRKLSLKR